MLNLNYVFSMFYKLWFIESIQIKSLETEEKKCHTLYEWKYKYSGIWHPEIQ